jgi:hypothetical protein
MQTDTGFTPATTVPGSRDQRFLGCWFKLAAPRR